MNQKSVIGGILLVVLLTITTTNVQASTNDFFGELGRDIGNSLAELGDDIDDASSNYNQGVRDGKHAGVNGQSSQCPSNDTVYCVGWNTGYNKGSGALETVNENRD